jgi:hypothetical protein
MRHRFWYNAPMATIKADAYRCDVCGYRWLPRADKWPKRCPDRKCRSSKWDSGKLETMTAIHKAIESLPVMSAKAQTPNRISGKVKI